MSRFRAVTFNTWNCQGDLDRRLPLMAAGLAGLDADIILLQEVFAGAPAGLHVGETLARTLGMGLAFAPARQKERLFRGASAPCVSGLAVLSRPPVGQAYSVGLPEDSADGERIAQVVTLGDARPLHVVNLHLTHLPGRGDLRRRQMAAALAAVPGDGLPVLLGGDLNAVDGAAPFDLLSDFARPALSDEGPRTSLNPVAGAAAEPGVIDHLMLRADGPPPVLTARLALDRPGPTDGIYPSDHKALAVEIVGLAGPA